MGFLSCNAVMVLQPFSLKSFRVSSGVAELISTKNCRFFFNPIIPPLEKGGEGGFKIRGIPLNPPLPKGEVNKGHLKIAPWGPPLPGEVPDEA